MALNDPNKNRKSKDPDYRKDMFRRLRYNTIESLGGKCVKCGFKDFRALQIDHIAGNGNAERKERGFNRSYHKRVINSFLANEGKYQLLCANCNWIKRVENGEVSKPKNKKEL